MPVSASNNLLFDKSYAPMNGLMVSPFGMPAGFGYPSSSPINPYGSYDVYSPQPGNMYQPPYTINDFKNEINGNNNPAHPASGVEDGLDDGKISFKSKLKNFGKGLISPITNIIKHPIASAAGLGVAALLSFATGGAILPVFIGIGVVAGVFNIGKGIYKQATAKTDAQAESAWRDIGSGTSDIGLSVLFSKGALKGSGHAPEGGFIKSVIQCFKNIPEALKTSAGMAKDGLAWYNIKNVFSNLFKKTPEFPIDPNQMRGSDNSVPKPRIGSGNSDTNPGGSNGTPVEISMDIEPGVHPKWNAETITQTIQDAYQKGGAAAAKTAYRDLLFEIHPDSCGHTYSNTSELTTILYEARKQYGL